MSESAKMFWVIDADIEGFFDNLDHQRLEQVLQDRTRDRKLRDLIWVFLKAGVMEEGTYRHFTTGTPQGGIVSPVLANIYLDGLDQWARRFTGPHKIGTEKSPKQRQGQLEVRPVRGRFPSSDERKEETGGKDGRPVAKADQRPAQPYPFPEKNQGCPRKKRVRISRLPPETEKRRRGWTGNSSSHSGRGEDAL
jgi:hypothetical protein